MNPDGFKLYNIVTNLLNDNPLYEVFYGSYGIGFTFAVVLLVACLVLLSKRCRTYGLLAAALMGSFVAASIPLAQHSSAIAESLTTSYSTASLIPDSGIVAPMAVLMSIWTAVLLCVTGYFAYQAKQSKWLQISAMLLLMSVSATLALSLFADLNPYDSPTYKWLVYADYYVWGILFVMMIATAVSALWYYLPCVIQHIRSRRQVKSQTELGATAGSQPTPPPFTGVQGIVTSR